MEETPEEVQEFATQVARVARLLRDEGWITPEACEHHQYPALTNKNMPEGLTKKVMERIMETIEVDGFYITSLGDTSAGIYDAEWTLSHKFYFDNEEEFKDFKELLYQMFENYVGEVVIETFDERQTESERLEREQYEQYPVRYLIMDGSNFKQAGSTASYSSSVGDGIHMEFPHWMSEDGYNGHSTRIIKSSDKEFRKILLDEAGRLEHEINNEEYRLRNAKRNLTLIQKELNYGK